MPTLPRLTVSGYFTGQVSIAGPDAGSDYWGFKDTLSMERGNHSWKFGAEGSYESIVHDTLLDNYGVFAFNGSKTGNAYADFLLGLPATMTQDAPVRKVDEGWYLSLFAQDDWRLSQKLTLNVGVRYDFYSNCVVEPTGSVDVRIKNLDPPAPNEWPLFRFGKVRPFTEPVQNDGWVLCSTQKNMRRAKPGSFSSVAAAPKISRYRPSRRYRKC